jgi:hypothetical protein
MPAYKLDVNGTVRAGDIEVGSIRSSGGIISLSGNVGIGTDSPQAPLHVAGKIKSDVGIEFPNGTVQTTAISCDWTGWFCDNADYKKCFDTDGWEAGKFIDAKCENGTVTQLTLRSYNGNFRN